MKKLIAIFSLSLSICALLFWFIQQPLVFLSLESKTDQGEGVYNRIKFIPGWNVDIWIMQQNHRGPNQPTNSWDRLAILVDKTKSPREASFYQFIPGELKFGTLAEQTAFRAPCYSCHASGPRAIRPATSNVIEIMKVGLLNLRIKTYFQSKSIAGQNVVGDVPFKRQHKMLEKNLPLTGCAMCHGENKIRNELTFDHLATAQFLVEKNEMPPWPLRLLDSDREKLARWGLNVISETKK